MPQIPTSERKTTSFSAFLSCQKSKIPVSKCTFYLFFILIKHLLSHTIIDFFKAFQSKPSPEKANIGRETYFPIGHAIYFSIFPVEDEMSIFCRSDCWIGCPYCIAPSYLWASCLFRDSSKKKINMCWVSWCVLLMNLINFFTSAAEETRRHSSGW